MSKISVTDALEKLTKAFTAEAGEGSLAEVDVIVGTFSNGTVIIKRNPDDAANLMVSVTNDKPFEFEDELDIFETIEKEGGDSE